MIQFLFPYLWIIISPFLLVCGITKEYVRLIAWLVDCQRNMVLCKVTDHWLTLCDSMDVMNQAPLSVRDYQARLLDWVAMPPSGDLLGWGIEPMLFVLPAFIMWVFNHKCHLVSPLYVLLIVLLGFLLIMKTPYHTNDEEEMLDSLSVFSPFPIIILINHLNHVYQKVF